jgi:flagellar biosynthetic protein FlhB
VSENNSSQDKSEEPTTQKKDKSRKDGQIARSKEVQSAALVLGGGMLILSSGAMEQFASELMYQNFMPDREAVMNPEMMLVYLGNAGSLAISTFLPFFVILWLIGFVSGMIPGGMNWSSKALMPKASKMDPIAGIKRMFSANSLTELGKSVLKVSLLLGIMVWTLWTQSDEILKMNKMSLGMAISNGTNILAYGIMGLGFGLLLISMIDVPFQLWSMTKKLKMTKQEVKDENKNSEGSPELKQRIRQIQAEMSNQQIRKRVPDADVVIMNPSHYAVALKYNLEMADAPYVVAKGTDEMALQIRKVANEFDTPIVEIPELARSVYYSTPVDTDIPTGLYVAVATVLRYVMELNHLKAAGNNTLPELPENLEIPESLKR